MLQKLRKRSNDEGFTIIEVLIVLAIAGLIMLIVFLAVPALQRNSRNTQRKNDVSRISGAVQEFINNNSGTAPTSSAGDTSAVVSNAGTLSYYNKPNTVSIVTAIPGTLPDADHVVIAVGFTCSGNTATAGTGRQIAVLYAVEASSGTTPQCSSS